jgi:hypothetical protein
MIRFESLGDRGLLVIHPEGALQAEGFDAVSAAARRGLEAAGGRA